jgi:CubicO group peptidase (beta-lactamase class C family)
MRAGLVGCVLVEVSLCVLLLSCTSRHFVKANRSAPHDYWPTTGWRVSTPQEQRIDPALLSKADEHIRADLPNVRTLLVIRHGVIVYEKYYAGNGPDSLESLRSVTKSVNSMLAGIALKEHRLKSVDQKLADFFPEAFPSNVDPRKRQITIKHLLTMTSGFAWDDRYDLSGWSASDDRMKYIIDQPLAHEPGETFNYNTAASHLIPGILTRALKQTLPEFAEEHLFKPLGISRKEWETDHQGYYIGVVAITPRDMAKLGYLYLKHGVWEGKQIIPADWVKQSTEAHSDGGFPEHSRYGYFWWLSTETGYSAFFAAGYGGQFIYVIPDLDMIVVITSNPSLRPAQLRDHRHLVRDFVAPAVKDAMTHKRHDSL